jgi:broad specificity phosphatase PhoE
MITKKAVYYMRHFEALHNIQPYNYDIPDAELSPLAKSQSIATIDVVKKIPQIDLIVCSPLTRALQTYLLVFENDDTRISPVIIHPYIQEVCSVPCDIGSPIDDLKKKFPTLSNELNLFEETFGDNEWRDKMNPESFYSPDRKKERATSFLHWLMNRSEQHIVVISHNLMLRELDQDKNQMRDLRNGEIVKIEYD